MDSDTFELSVNPLRLQVRIGGQLQRGRSTKGTEAIIRILQNDRIITHLVVDFYRCPRTTLWLDHEPYIFFQNHISNGHQLQQFTIRHAKFPGAAESVRRFLLAAAQSTNLYQLNINGCSFWSGQTMQEFCNVNSGVRSLSFTRSLIVFAVSDEQARSDYQPHDVNVERLTLNRLTFQTETALDSFVDQVVAQMANTYLEFGGLRFDKDRCYRIRVDPWYMTMPKLIRPHVTTLKLLDLYEPDEQRDRATTVALITSKVEHLIVVIHTYAIEIIDIVAKAMQHMKKLRILTFAFEPVRPCIPRGARQEFHRAFGACTNLVEYNSNCYRNSMYENRAEIRFRHAVIKRNRLLRRVIANPIAADEKEFLRLMLQLQQCPTGLYELMQVMLPIRSGNQSD